VKILNEERLLIYTKNWEREDPVVQLPPGVSMEKSFTQTVGLSKSVQEELSASLGVWDCPGFPDSFD
jgi:hypothetical protein